MNTDLAVLILGEPVAKTVNGVPVLTSGQPMTSEQQTLADLASAMDWPFVDAEDSLGEAKAKRVQLLDNRCQVEYQSDLVTSDGLPFRTHLEAIIDVQMIIGLIAPLEVYTGYKCADGVERDITREQFETALQEGAVRKMTAFAKRKTLKDQVLAAVSKEALEQIPFWI